MIAAIHGLNWALTNGFELLYRPLRLLGPFGSLVLISLLTGVFMVWVFGKVSDQAGIERVRNRIRGNLIGVRLFQNDIGVFLRIQGVILMDTLRYMRYSLKPMLILMVPLVLIIVQLHLQYGSRPLGEGERALVKVRFSEGAVPADPSKVSLEAGKGATVETPGVWIPSEREMAWRIRGDAAGRYALEVRNGAAAVKKELRVGPGWGSVSSLRSGPDWVDLLLYPKEAPISQASGIDSVEIGYPPLKISLFDWNVNWLVGFFILSIVFGFALKGFLGVEV